MFGSCVLGPPDQLRGCDIKNQTSDSIHVECVTGSDNGLPIKHYVMEVHDISTTKLKSRVSHKIPTFTATGLDSDMNFMLLLYSVNSKGRSEKVTLYAKTMRVAERRMLGKINISIQ